MNLIWHALLYVTWRGFLAGAGLGALYGTAVFPFIGTAYGALYGAVVGLGAGIGCGLYIGLLTRVAYYPPSDFLRYQRVLVLTTTTLAYIAANLGFTALIGPGFFSGSISPTLVAAGAAIYVSLGFAARYQGYEKPKRKREASYG
jgi:hypothetical protein